MRPPPAQTGGPGGAQAADPTARPPREGGTTARAGHHDAAVAVHTASSIPAAITHHGTSNRSMRCPAAGSTAPATATHSSSPAAVPDHGGDGADGRAVGHQHQAQVPVGGAGGRQQADLPLAALGHDHEPGRGHERNQQQHHGRHEVGDQGGGSLLDRAAVLDERPGVAAAVGPRPDLVVGGVDQDGHGRRAGRRAGRRPGRTRLPGPRGPRQGRPRSSHAVAATAPTRRRRRRASATSSVRATSPLPDG